VAEKVFPLCPLWFKVWYSVFGFPFWLLPYDGHESSRPQCSMSMRKALSLSHEGPPLTLVRYNLITLSSANRDSSSMPQYPSASTEMKTCDRLFSSSKVNTKTPCEFVRHSLRIISFITERRGRLAVTAASWIGSPVAASSTRTICARTRTDGWEP